MDKSDQKDRTYVIRYAHLNGGGPVNKERSENIHERSKKVKIRTFVFNV